MKKRLLFIMLGMISCQLFSMEPSLTKLLENLRANLESLHFSLQPVEEAPPSPKVKPRKEKPGKPKKIIRYRTAIGGRGPEAVLVGRLPKDLSFKLQQQPDDNRRNPDRYKGIDLFFDYNTGRISEEIKYIDELQPGAILVVLIGNRNSFNAEMVKEFPRKDITAVFFDFVAYRRPDFEEDPKRKSYNQQALKKLVQALQDKGF